MKGFSDRRSGPNAGSHDPESKLARPSSFRLERSASKPIPISSHAAGVASGATSGSDFTSAVPFLPYGHRRVDLLRGGADGALSSSLPPRAPVIGSLPEPAFARQHMPALRLPPPTPEGDEAFVVEQSGQGLDAFLSVHAMASSCPGDVEHITRRRKRAPSSIDFSSCGEEDAVDDGTFGSLTALSVLQGELDEFDGRDDKQGRIGTEADGLTSFGNLHVEDGAEVTGSESQPPGAPENTDDQPHGAMFHFEVGEKL